MTNPKRPENHVLDSKAKKFLEGLIPDEWIYNIPSNDYGLDYQVEICLDGQVTGLNFSIQLKGHQKSSDTNFAKAVLKHSTISYYKVRLEPIMIVVYEDDTKQAYWSWLNDHDIDLSKGQKEYIIKVPKINVLTLLKWDLVINHVQTIFNNRSFISDFDISKIHDNLELAAWKVYHDGRFEQAVYLFRQLLGPGSHKLNILQALCWSLFQSYRYPEALTLINDLILQHPKDNLMQIKACIMAEYGIATMDKGKIIQAKNIFGQSLNEQASNLVHYNYGNTLAALGENQSAVEQYKISLKKDSYYAQCWKNLGTSQGHLCDHEEEIKSYQTALSIDPNLFEALFSMGIALAKDFRKYDEALKYFTKALAINKTTKPGYVSGLYWVAESYLQTGNIQSALYWLDYGLNFQGNNSYLLNLKTKLLAENWPKYPELKPQAEDFFQYRLELSHDGLSLNYLIRLKNWNLDEAYPLLQQHHPLFKNLKLKTLQDFGFDLEMACIVLLNFVWLADFKSEHKVTRYVNHLINPHYSIGPEFYELLDIISAYAFNKYIQNFNDTRSAVEAAKLAIDVLINMVPKLVPYLVETDKTFDQTDADAVLYFLFNGLETIVYREIGAISGFLSFKFGLTKVDPADYISNEQNLLLKYNLLVEINNFLAPLKA